MVSSILVPLDGTEFAEHALPMATCLARTAGATVHLVHVSDWPRGGDLTYLSGLARRLNEKTPVKTVTALLEGEIVAELQDYAERESIDLVVMCTHARGVLGRFWMGSVADDLELAINVPVLLIRPAEGKPDLKDEGGLKSIVIPLDGTELAEKAIAPALELGKLFDAEFTLVRVVTPAVLSAYLPEGAGPHTMTVALEEAAELDRREMEDARVYLEGVAERMKAEGVRVHTHVMCESRPAEGILAEATAEHADLIAIETHARRGLARMFMGSVADSLVTGGGPPVLVAHPVR
jgi:nucleotide-binding universal stress UspA family protein